MSDASLGLYEEFAELVAATRSLIEADSARGVAGYPKRSPQQSQERQANRKSMRGPDSELTAVAGSGAPEPPESMRVPREKALVVGVQEGVDSAEVVIVGSWMSGKPSASRRPFSGPSGEMLDKMLQHVLGMSRADVVLVEALSPDSETVQSTVKEGYKSYVSDILKRVKPRFVLAMGELGAQAVLPQNASLDEARGVWRNIGGREVLATYEPSHLIAHPEDKRHVFGDLKRFRARMDASRRGRR